jgi:hypothetical protein
MNLRGSRIERESDRRCPSAGRPMASGALAPLQSYTRLYGGNNGGSWRLHGGDSGGDEAQAAGAAAGLRAGTAARRVHPGAEPRGTGARGHARSARAHHLRAPEDRRATGRVSAASRCWCRRRSPSAAARWRWRRSRRRCLPASACVVEVPRGEERLVLREIPVSLQGADVEQLLRDVLADLIEYGSSARVANTRTRCSRPWPATAPCAPTGASRSRR